MIVVRAGVLAVVLLGMLQTLTHCGSFDHESYKQCSRRERPLYDHGDGRPPRCD